MTARMLESALLDDDGYPSWVTALADQHCNVALYVVRDLEPSLALERVGARAHQIRPVELPSGPPSSEWSSLVMDAVGVHPGAGSALVAWQVGDWTIVYDGGGLTTAYVMAENSPVSELSRDGREAASCSDNVELDTHLAYAVDGQEIFSVSESVSICQLEELPEGLRPAAQAAGIDWSDGSDDGPAENFRVVCVLADLHITLDHLRSRPLLGGAFG